MKFPKPRIFRKNKAPTQPLTGDHDYPQPSGKLVIASSSTDYTARLHPSVLRRIFTYVCPHTLDRSYKLLDDEVIIGDNCPLCDLRDLANCLVTCKSWHDTGTPLLYGSIRLDSIHYCPLESKLREARHKKTKSRWGRSTYNLDEDYVYDPSKEPASERIKLLADTVRFSIPLSSFVEYLKLPHALREDLNKDVVRAIGACQNLRYVDLPNSFFKAEFRFEPLRHELWNNCSELAVMTYLQGSERYFRQLGDGHHWKNLGILTLENIRVESTSFRRILGALQKLDTLIIKNLPDINDDIFSVALGLPDFPALRAFEIHDQSSITSAGLLRYLTTPSVRNTLQYLTLDMTGVQITRLHPILAAANTLLSLTLVQPVNSPLSLEMPPLLASSTLQTLHYEITDSSNASTMVPPPSASYYQYLLQSITNNSLPALRALYVRDPNFPTALTNCHRPSKRDLSEPESPTLPIIVGDYIPEETSSNFSLLSSSASPASLSSFNTRHKSSRRQPNSINNPNNNRSSVATFASMPAVQPLEVYTKGLNELEWLFAALPAPAPPPSSSGKRNSRAISTFNEEWASNARRSVIIKDGFGGWQNVPDGPLPATPGNHDISRIDQANNRGSGLISNSGTPEIGYHTTDNGFLAIPSTEVKNDASAKSRSSWWSMTEPAFSSKSNRGDMWR